MIVTIVDSAGAQIYRGHEGNKKVAQLINANNVRVDIMPPDEFAIWNDVTWQLSLPPTILPENTPTTIIDIEQYLIVNDPSYATKIAAIKRSRPE